MNIRLVATFVGILGATIFVSSGRAQGRVAFAHTGPAGATLSRGGGKTSFAHLRRARRFFAGAAFAPYYDYGSDYEPAMVEVPPPYIIVQTQPALSAPAPKSSESLVLELRGDHWVRIANDGVSQTEQSSQLDSEQAAHLPTHLLATTRRTEVAVAPSSLPPAVLVFRDGHKEEVEKYVIEGTTLFTNADYWSTGSWTRKIQIAELDVPGTLKLNQERGAKFSLPSGPNEVMMRP